MVWNEVITALVLGVVGGIAPGPVIFMALSEIIRSPDKGIRSGMKYIIAAGLTEFFIGIFLIATSTWLKIPAIVFHLFTILGIGLLVFIAVQFFKIKGFDYKTEQSGLSIRYVIIFMLLNGPLWLFWLSVCLPTAFELGAKINNGEYLFAIIFEVSVMATLAAIFFAFNSFKRFFSNKNAMQRIFFFLGLIILFFALKMIMKEILFWF